MQQWFVGLDLRIDKHMAMNISFWVVGECGCSLKIVVVQSCLNVRYVMKIHIELKQLSSQS